MYQLAIVCNTGDFQYDSHSSGLCTEKEFNYTSFVLVTLYHDGRRARVTGAYIPD
jgi:hypothetical protein